MSNEYPLNLYKLPKLTDDILEYDNDYKSSKHLNEPLISLGFHYYLHQSKDKMEILNDLKFKNKDFYLVVNEFEHKINDYDDDILSITEKKFKINTDNKKVISRAYYKLWEILKIFDLIPLNNSIITAHLAEAPGSFVQAVIMYRDLYSKNKSQNDKYCAISLNEKNNSIKIQKKKLECYSKKDSQRFFLHKTTKEDNGDITNLDNINNFKNEIESHGDKAYLVTADGGFIWKNENYQEQESYKLILGQILACIKIQKLGGNFVIKIFDIFTKLTIKLINIIQSFYDNVFIYKPYTSRLSNSEKYIIAKNFKSNNLQSKIKKLENLLENMPDNCIDIISNYNIQNNIFTKIKDLNINLSNKQFIEMNKIISYINEKDYFGDKYHIYLKNQINASKYWINLFYDENNNINKIINTINK